MSFQTVGYTSNLVLNTPHLADCRTRQICGFFTTIGFHLWPGSAFAEKQPEKAKATGRLDAVFKYLAAFTEHEGEPE